MSEIALITGGWVAERLESIASAVTVKNSLERLGHRVRYIEFSRDLSHILKSLDPRPDIAFTMIFGEGGEGGWLQSILNMLEIPYTHSGVAASAIGIDKKMSKRIASSIGCLCAEDFLVGKSNLSNLKDIELTCPLMMKPNCEGSSTNMYLLKSQSDIDDLSGEELNSEEYIVEEYILGRDLAVSVMDDKAQAVVETTTSREFYDFIAKSEDIKNRKIPASIPDKIYDLAMEQALAMHTAIGASGITRTDYRYDDTGDIDKLYFLEINTIPGMTEGSSVPQIAEYMGYDYDELVQWMLDRAQYEK